MFTFFFVYFSEHRNNTTLEDPFSNYSIGNKALLAFEERESGDDDDDDGYGYGYGYGGGEQENYEKKTDSTTATTSASIEKGERRRKRNTNNENENENDINDDGSNSYSSTGFNNKPLLSKCKLLALNFTWFGIAAAWFLLSVTIVPLQVKAIIGEDDKGVALGGTIAAGSVITVVLSPLMGMIR